jgi:PAS domain S-box-containing protein
VITESDALVAFSDVLYDRNPIPMFVYDAQTLRFLSVNDAAVTAYGYSREEFVAMTLPDIRLAAERDESRSWAAARDAGRSFRTPGGWRHARRDGTIMEVEIENSSRIEYAGVTAIVAMIFDVSERNRNLIGLDAHRAMVHEAHDVAGLGTFMLDVQTQTFALGGLLARAYGRAEIRLCELAAEVARIWHPDDSAEARRLLDSIERFEPYDGEFRMYVDGEIRWFHGRTNIVVAPDGTSTGMAGVAVDVTDRKREAERLRAIAFTDAATGLPNRAALLEDSTMAVDDVAGLLLVRVTSVADTSQRGDEARARSARAVAATLRRLAPQASLYRFSEDTFAFVTPRTERLRVPLPLAKRVVAAFERPLSVNGDEFVVIPKIGVAVADGGDRSLGELSRRADAALHAAVRGDASIVLYTAELAEALDRRATIDCNLRHAIAAERIGVVYQPILSLESGLFIGAEALMRWACPGIGTVPPSEFIAIAEESGVIVRLGDWILREACRQTRRWQLEGHEDFRVAVNVSARQADEREFFRTVMTACEAADLAPHYLELELTERVMMQPGGLALRNLEALRRAGVRVSVDDFGTGYSALSYLASLPLDAIKLDRSFTTTIADDPFQAAIVSGIIRLAHGRGLSVVGEGIETSVQHERLRAMGCDEAQGYLFSHPVEGEDLSTLLRRQSQRLTAKRPALFA